MRRFFMCGAGFSDTEPAPPTPPTPSKIAAIGFSVRGQSNALGRALTVDLPTVDQEEQTDIYIYNEFYPVKYKAGEFYVNLNSYSFELFLAQKLRDYKSQPVYIDKTAKGGTRLAVDAGADDWNLTTNELWLTGKNRYSSYKLYQSVFNFNTNNKFIVWFQGESDSDLQVYSDAYEANQTAIFADYRSFIGDPNFPIIDCLISSTYNTYSPQIRQAKINIAAADTNIHLVETDSLDRFDGVHLSQQGLRDLAELIFQIVKDF